MGTALDMGTAAAQGRADAAITRANGRLQRNQAYADAYKLEADAAAGSVVAGDNLMVMRRNQALQVAAVRAANGASGFAVSGGSKLGVERSTAEIFDLAIANAVRSNAVAEQNARAQAGALRRAGDAGLGVANAQADYLGKVARVNGSMVPWALVGGGLSTASGLFNTYNVRKGDG